MKDEVKCSFCEETSTYPLNWALFPDKDVFICPMCIQIKHQQGDLEVLSVKDNPKEKKVVYIEKPKEIEIKDEKISELPQQPMTRKEVLEMLDAMINSYERLPQEAMLQSVTHSDHYSLLMVLSALFRSN